MIAYTVSLVAKKKREVRPRFELGLLESEPNVITTYTIGPLHKVGEIVIQKGAKLPMWQTKIPNS